jgi:HEAT repeat protein
VEPDSKSVEALVAALHDDKWRVRSAAANTFWKMEHLAEPAMAEIVECLSDSQPEVRIFAAQSLGRLAENGVNTIAAIPPLTKLCDDTLFSTVALAALKQMEGSSNKELSDSARSAMLRLKK